jgi:uncharacterized protein (TIGR00369 family)
MLGAIGFEPLEVGDGRCRAAMDSRPEVRQPLGLIHTGALVTLADATATCAALTVTDPGVTWDLDRFPYAVQVSTNVMRNTDRGRITAEARVVHRGRTMQVVETQVRDDAGRLLALVTTTHVVVPRNNAAHG